MWVGGNQHVVRRQEGWAVVAEDSNRPVICTRTQSEALAVAHRIAQAEGADVIVHSRHGQYRERGNAAGPTRSNGSK